MEMLKSRVILISTRNFRFLKPIFSTLVNKKCYILSGHVKIVNELAHYSVCANIENEIQDPQLIDYVIWIYISVMTDLRNIHLAQ
jgi:hypothetical protein